MNAEYTGKQIAEFRKAKGLTQKELANKIHVTDKAVSKWERGINFPDLGLIEELARELDTTPSILLGIEDATKEEIVTSFTEMSIIQSEEAEKDIQKIGWVNLLAGIFLIVFMYFINIKLQRNGLYFESESLLWFIYGLIGVVTVGAIYTLRKYKAIRKWETLDVVLTEIIIIDLVVFLAIQLFTGHNPNYIVSSILIGIGSVCIEVLFYRVMRPWWMKALPLVLMMCWLFWGILLELTEAVWVNDNMWNLIVYSGLPAVCAVVTWFVCRKRDVQKVRLIPNIKLITVIFVVVSLFVGIFGQDMLAKVFVKVFHNHLENYAEGLLKECDCTISDNYGFWKVTCYPEDNMVQFSTGGAGLVANSVYEGFYYSSDNTHKPFQGADVPLIVNKDLAHWNGEGDNWGKSTRLIDKWFWYEAHF